MLKGLPLIADKDTKILIAGSFPGTEALSRKEYYAHPRNQFWTIMGSVIGMDIVNLSYKRKIEMMLDKRIGLWNVFSMCEREGSLDSGIRNPILNDFTKLRKIAPALREIYFNGIGIGRYRYLAEDNGYRAAVLPSSSPAHAIPLKRKN